MAPEDRVRLALDHIAEALEDLTILTSDLDEAAFKQDRLKRRVAERCIEVISDASSERRPAILVPKKSSAGVQGIIMIPWLCSDAGGGTRPLLYAKTH